MQTVRIPHDKSLVTLQLEVRGYMPWLFKRRRVVIPEVSDFSMRRVVACKFNENVVKGKCFLIRILKSSALLVWANGNVTAFITLNSRTEQGFGFGSLTQQFWFSNPEARKKQYRMTQMIHDV